MPKKYLVIAPAWVGDAVMSHTLIKLLKTNDTTALIDVVAPSSTAALFARMAEVHQTFLLPVKPGGLQLKARYRLGRALQAFSYDQAFVLPNSWKSALVPYFARVPKRTGWRGEMRYGLLNDWRVLNPQALPLMIQRFYALGLAPQQKLPIELPWPTLRVSATNQKKLQAQWQIEAHEKRLILCPGAEYGPSKQWPADYFAVVAKNYPGRVLILGSPKDQAIAEQIQQSCNALCLNLVGKTSLLDAIDLMALADAVVTNDSGLMHIASALERPTVALYGSTSPAFTPPLNKKVAVLSLGLACSPCFQRVCPLQHHDCLKQLKPEHVVEALSRVE